MVHFYPYSRYIRFFSGLGIGSKQLFCSSGSGPTFFSKATRLQAPASFNFRKVFFLNNFLMLFLYSRTWYRSHITLVTPGPAPVLLWVILTNYSFVVFNFFFIFIFKEVLSTGGFTCFCRP